MKRIKKKKERPVILDQWAEITRRDGQTVTTLYPPNKELEKLRLEMDPPPVLVYRRLNFVHGVPPEYLWTEPSPHTETFGGAFLQRLSIEDWLKVYAQERSDTCAHIVTAERSQERPPELGPCPCRRCTRKRELEDQAA